MVASHALSWARAWEGGGKILHHPEQRGVVGGSFIHSFIQSFIHAGGRVTTRVSERPCNASRIYIINIKRYSTYKIAFIVYRSDSCRAKGGVWSV